MEYEMPKLINLAGWLAERYTSKDTSSITYDTAGMLMDAVLYCIREYENLLSDDTLSQDDLSEAGLSEAGPSEVRPAKRTEPDVETAFHEGYQAVLAKVTRAGRIYEELVKEFEDYGCKNYRDTITRGIPGFFVRYDARFRPQEHILTLDYPVMGGNTFKRGDGILSGIDLIYVYLKVIRTEKKFLDCFDRQAVVNLMSALYPQYEDLYLDNLCSPVLLNAAGCLIAGKPVGGLEMGRDGLNLLGNYFAGCGKEEIESRLKPCIRILTGGCGWFDMAAGHYAPQIENAVKFGCLERLFQV